MPPKGRAPKTGNLKSDSASLEDVGASGPAQAGKRKRDLPLLGASKLTLTTRPSHELQPQTEAGPNLELNSIEDLKLWAQNRFIQLNASLEADMSGACLTAIKDLASAIQETAKDHQTRTHTLLSNSKEMLGQAQTQHAQALEAVAKAQSELTSKVEKDRSQLLADLQGGVVAESLKTIKALQSKYKL